MQLQEIYRPITRELSAVDQLVSTQLKGADGLIAIISDHIISAPGKRLRPALVLLSARVGGRRVKQAVALAAAVELIHTATLVQDDVIDRAGVRRGRPAVARVFGSGVSILFGDYLFSQAFSLLATIKDFRLLDILVQATRAMAVGEIEQLRLAGQRISERQYLKIIKQKTAGLMAACCQTGGQVGGASAGQVKALAAFGLNFGLAFQIVDDCLDQTASVRQIKKSTRRDKRMDKYTLPAIYGSTEQALTKAKAFMGKAHQELKLAPPDQQRDLIALGEFVLNQV